MGGRQGRPITESHLPGARRVKRGKRGVKVASPMGAGASVSALAPAPEPFEGKAMLRAPRICSCGNKVASGETCPCQRRAARERKARADAERPSASQRGYGSKWREAREVFLAANPVCATPKCGAPATVVDHVTPHKGDLALFWRRSNWQPLCARCHNRKTARHDGAFGRPVKCD